MKIDPEFKENQHISNRKWAANNPGYWRQYRLKNPEKAERNRVLQSLRNRRRKEGLISAASPIAKVDASNRIKKQLVGRFWLVPMIAKVDALKVNIVEMPDPYG